MTVAAAPGPRSGVAARRSDHQPIRRPPRAFPPGDRHRRPRGHIGGRSRRRSRRDRGDDAGARQRRRARSRQRLRDGLRAPPELLVAGGDTVERGSASGSSGRRDGPPDRICTSRPGWWILRDPAPLLPPEGDPAEALRRETMTSLRDTLVGVRDVVLAGHRRCTTTPVTRSSGSASSRRWQSSAFLRAAAASGVVRPAPVRRPLPPGNGGPPLRGRQLRRRVAVRATAPGVGAPGDQGSTCRPAPRSHCTSPTPDGVVGGCSGCSARDDVLLTWRDHHSLHAAHDLFPASESRLVPDVAFARRPPPPCATARDEIVWIAGVDDPRKAERCATAGSRQDA